MQKYFSLTKPGMVRGNVIVAAAAFVFASGGNINWILLFFTITGLALVVASACVFNNYYDRNIDARMERTKERALAKGVVSGERALFFGLLLFVLGVIALQIHTTQYALFAALTGFFVYVFLYTPLKHQHSSALYVGAFAGATPPLVGYMAVLPQLDTTALLLFLALFLWQIPHFVAIALYRFDEYTAAGIPLVIKNPPKETTKRIARKVFHYSLVFLLIGCVLLAAYPYLAS